jgi:hypothetical protein
MRLYRKNALSALALVTGITVVLAVMTMSPVARHKAKPMRITARNSLSQIEVSSPLLAADQNAVAGIIEGNARQVSKSSRPD